MEGQYPQLTKDRSMLEHLHREITESWARGEFELRLWILRVPEKASIRYQETYEKSIEGELGISGPEAIGLFERLYREGYIHADFPGSEGMRQTVILRSLTTQGLIEIGVLPDPKERLLLGLRAALWDVEQDPTLRPEEKEEKLNAGREAINFIRGLAVEVAAKVIVGG